MTQRLSEDSPLTKSQETQRYAGNLNGIEIKLTYYYKGISFLRQISEHKILYKTTKTNNKEEAQKC